MPNQIDQARFQYLVEKGLSKAYEENIKFLSQTKPMREKLYKNFPSDGAYSDFNSVGSLPDMPRFGGSMLYFDVPPGYHVRIEPAEFGMGVEVEKKFWLNNLYNVLNDWPKKLVVAADRTKEKAAIKGYAAMNSTGFDFMQSEEGVAIASTAHLTKADYVVTSAGGFSNLGTSAFLPTSVEATRILMRGFRDSNGEYLSVMPNGFIGPTTLDQKFEEVTTTPKGLYTADGTVNVQANKGWTWDTSQFFNDYSTKSWWMIDWQLLAEYALWIDVVTNETANKVDFETKKIKTSIYDYWGYGFTDWRFLYMHVGS
jgi:hypothetical protein